MKNRSLFVLSFVICLLTGFYTAGFAQQKPAEKKSYAASQKGSHQLKSLTILYENGKTIEVNNPALKYLVNPGYVPSRYAPTPTIEFTKTGANTISFQVADIISIEYLKNKLNECVCILTLKDGRKTLTAQYPAHVLAEYWTEKMISMKIDVLPDFKGYAPGDYQISGLVNGHKFETNTGTFFDCLQVWDDLEQKFIVIAKITFNYAR